eukprot:8838382-Pyramimonas_sp.AAC.1
MWIGQINVHPTTLRRSSSLLQESSHAPCSMAACHRSTPIPVRLLKVRATSFSGLTSSSSKSSSPCRAPDPMAPAPPAKSRLTSRRPSTPPRCPPPPARGLPPSPWCPRAWASTLLPPY